MPTYSFCNIALESDLPFFELQVGEKAEPEYRIKVSWTLAIDDSGCEWFHTWSGQDDKPWLKLGRQAGGYFLRFPGMADFAVSHDGKEIRCCPVLDTPGKTVRHLILDQVMPLLLSRRGRLVLHGSAISTPQGAIAFIGQSGWGKSTLATSFSQNGMTVLTDDCLVIEENAECLTVIPTYPGVRLWPETAFNILGTHTFWTEVAHYTEKKRVDTNAGIRFCSWPRELQRVYFLSPPRESATVTVEPMPARDTMLELVKYTYLIDTTDRSRLRKEFERLGRFSLKPLFYRLTFPHDFSQLAKVRDAIVRA
jgi:hypothetical protein